MACDITKDRSSVTWAEESAGDKGTSFLSHRTFGVGTPSGGIHRISARLPNSTRIGFGANPNGFLISNKISLKRKNYYNYNQFN